MIQVWARGSRFQVEKFPTSLYQRDSVFSVFIKPFHPMGYVHIPNLDHYGEQYLSFVSIEPLYETTSFITKM
jgi:hypothetical protein